MTRFEKLKKKLRRKGVKNPAALAAWIGRRKYGEKEFEKLEERGKAKAAE